MQGCVAVAPVRECPEDDGRQRDQLLFGEIFDVLHEAEGWCFGRGRRDGVIGWVEAPALSAPVLLATQLLHAFTFAAQHAASIALLNLYFPGAMRGRGQALYSMLGYGCSGVVGGVAGGWLGSRYGFSAVFWAASLAALMAWMALRAASRAERLAPMPAS